jgi:beta-1,4-mannosyl-glycoprotein beta-1,4-N-acetylglucosaminyltransferase
MEGIKDCNADDIIIISDLDEIPNLRNINFSTIKERLIFFRQKILFYKFNLLYKNRFWFGSRACKKKYLISPQWIRDVKHKKYNFFRFDLVFSRKKYSDIFHVKDGGWHYTNLKSAKDIFKKLSNYAHYLEFQLSKIKLIDIKKMILKKRAIYSHEVDQRENKFNGEIKLHKFSKKYWPEYLKLNYSKYKKWIV